MQPAVTAVRSGLAEERCRRAQNSEVNAVAAVAVVLGEVETAKSAA